MKHNLNIFPKKLYKIQLRLKNYNIIKCIKLWHGYCSFDLTVMVIGLKGEANVTTTAVI